jgi:hypothetical protein
MTCPHKHSSISMLPPRQRLPRQRLHCKLLSHPRILLPTLSSLGLLTLAESAQGGGHQQLPPYRRDMLVAAPPELWKTGKGTLVYLSNLPTSPRTLVWTHHLAALVAYEPSKQCMWEDYSGSVSRYQVQAAPLLTATHQVKSSFF